MTEDTYQCRLCGSVNRSTNLRCRVCGAMVTRPSRFALSSFPDLPDPYEDDIDLTPRGVDGRPAGRVRPPAPPGGSVRPPSRDQSPPPRRPALPPGRSQPPDRSQPPGRSQAPDRPQAPPAPGRFSPPPPSGRPGPGPGPGTPRFQPARQPLPGRPTGLRGGDRLLRPAPPLPPARRSGDPPVARWGSAADDSGPSGSGNHAGPYPAGPRPAPPYGGGADRPAGRRRAPAAPSDNLPVLRRPAAGPSYGAQLPGGYGPPRLRPPELPPAKLSGTGYPSPPTGPTPRSGTRSGYPPLPQGRYNRPDPGAAAPRFTAPRLRPPALPPAGGASRPNPGSARPGQPPLRAVPQTGRLSLAGPNPGPRPRAAGPEGEPWDPAPGGVRPLWNAGPRPSALRDRDGWRGRPVAERAGARPGRAGPTGTRSRNGKLFGVLMVAAVAVVIILLTTGLGLDRSGSGATGHDRPQSTLGATEPGTWSHLKTDEFVVDFPGRPAETVIAAPGFSTVQATRWLSTGADGAVGSVVFFDLPGTVDLNDPNGALAVVSRNFVAEVGGRLGDTVKSSQEGSFATYEVDFTAGEQRGHTRFELTNRTLFAVTVVGPGDTGATFARMVDSFHIIQLD